MYLISQLWWFLLLAFLLGALLGYLLWRACGLRRIENHYQRSKNELVTRLGALEQERSQFTGAAVDAEGDNAKLKTEIAILQGKLADTSSRMNVAVDTADTKLKSYVDSVRHREEALSADIEKLKKEALEARKAWDAEKAAAKAREDKLANDLALAKKSAEDLQRKHTEDLKAAEKRFADEAHKKHADELKKVQEKARTEQAALHAAELKKVLEQAKQRDTKVLALTQADTSARKELEDAKARHAAELKKARDDAAAEAVKKHTDEVRKARDQAVAEAQAKHSEELKKFQEQAKQHDAKVLALTQADTSARKELEDAKGRHAAELKRARDEAAAEAVKKHADDVRKARDQAVAEAQAKHSEELKKFQEQAKQHDAKVLALTQADTDARKALEAAKVRHAAELKKVREDVTAEAAKKNAEDLKKSRDQALAEMQAKHAEELKKARDEATATAKRAHDDELVRFKREAVAFVSPAPSPTPSSAAPARGKAPGSIGAARGGMADDLKLIWGVGPEIEKLLNQNGIYHFDQIAAWTKADLVWFDSISKVLEGRVEQEKWVEQSKKLATGWRPDREIGEKPAGLTVLSSPRDGKADDLKLIWGVGPKLEKMLNGAGFFHFDQIAKWGAADIQWVDSQLGEFAGRAVRDKWVEQCKKLATGWRPASDVGEKPE